MSEKSKETAARYLPLLFFLVPIVLIVLPFFVCFKDGEYTFVAIFDGQGISAGAVSMYQCFNYLGGFTAVAFYFALAVALGASIFGAMPAFKPQLLKTRFYRPIVLIAFGVAALAMILACVLLALGVEEKSAQYFASVGRDVERTSGFLHADLTFYFEMASPLIVFIWWGWAMAIDHRIAKKAG